MSEIERVLRTRATDPHELYPITDKDGIARRERMRAAWNALATDVGFSRDEKAWPMTGQDALTGLYLDSEPPKPTGRFRAFLARVNGWLGSHDT